MTLRHFALAALLALPAGVSSQVASAGPESEEEPLPDTGDVRGEARRSQARFERVRLRHAPLAFGSGSARCDEHVGRFCTTYDEGEWYPRPEPDEVVEARATLLHDLDSLQRLTPADDWIRGQRVWYRAEAGDWHGALGVARDCGTADLGWCSALEGLALHGLGRYEAALRAFERALSAMDPDVSASWRVPERAVDRDAREGIRDARDAGADSLTSALATLWALADPLYLVEGNDRLTAHYARHTVAALKREARNPYGLSWAEDLEELTVRHGWEVGWERARSSLAPRADGAVGHKHPEGRDYLPSGRALSDPASAGVSDLAVRTREPRSLYAPPYAPVLLPMESVVSVFPRRDGAVVVATAWMPEDSSFHARHTHPRPWMEPGEQAGAPDRIGLFAMSPGDGALVGRIEQAVPEGVLALEVASGDWVVSVESWSPEARRAGRSRFGLRARPPTEDVATLSDLLLLRGREGEPAALDEALPLALIRARVGVGAPLAIGWEVSGLGFREELLEYAVSVERTDRGFFRRIGQIFGLGERPRPLALSWREPGPDAPGHRFRFLDLDLPRLEPGKYEIVLVLRTSGRSDARVTRAFEVTDD